MLNKSVEIGDHVVIFGKVTEAFSELHKLRESEILLYYVNGSYSPPLEEEGMIGEIRK